MAIKDEILDQLMKGYEKPEDLLGEDGLLQELKKALVERALGEELTHHLCYEKGEKSSRDDGNTRNGYGKKKVKSSSGELELSIPRDRKGSFEPQLIKKGQRHFDGFDDKISSMYARGMTVREIQGHLKELYGVKVSPDLISRVTEGIMKEVKDWQNRSLDALYPLVIFDALQVKIRDEGAVRNKAVYLALGMNTDGIKQVLGLWIEQTEGAKFWLRVMSELKNRGVQDILNAAVDGLKGFPEAITSIFPKAQVQTCIVHMVRHSLRFVPWKDKKQVAADLKAIYKAENAEATEDRLTEFEQKWDPKYPTIGQSCRKAVKARGHFPNDQAATKLLYLAIKNLTVKWKNAPRGWTSAMNQFAILFDDRLKAVGY